MTHGRLLLVNTLLALGSLLLTSSAAAQGEDAPKYLLRYKFNADEVVRTKVSHMATSETRIQGVSQTSKSRSESTKVWRIVKLHDNGNITFEHLVQDVNMWQHNTGLPEVRYDSTKDEEIPPQYERVAQTLGKPIAEVTITATGLVMAREGYPPGFNLGLGPIATPLPNEAVAEGTKWHIPSEIRVPIEGNKIKRIKTRQQFVLESVKTGVARISVTTQVLTPIDDPAIEAKLVQHVTNGFIKFDIDAGRIISKQIDWDEEVVGFNGADSMLAYLARFTETSETAPAVARREE